MIVYTTIPTREADKQYSYTFDKWDPAFESGVTTVTDDMSFKATYSTKLQEYIITFLTEKDGTQIAEVPVVYGSDANEVAPDKAELVPPSPDLVFGSWSEDISHVEGNMTVWPIWVPNVSAIDNQMVNGKSQNGKYLQNGQLYIRRGDKTFNVIGSLVK